LAVKRRASRGAAFVEVLVIVGIVLALGVAAITMLGRSSSEHAGKEATCIQTFGCNDGSSGTVALPGTGTGSGDGADPALWGGTQADLDRWRTESPDPRYSSSMVGRILARGLVPEVPAGSAAGLAEGRENLVRALSTLPLDVLMALRRDGVEIRVARDKIEDALPPELRNYHPPAYPPGVNLGDASGVYLHRDANHGPLVLLAVDANGRPANSGSMDVIFHEVGHAYDYTVENGRSQTAAFVRARNADLAAQGIRDGYYLTTAEGGNQTRPASANAETFGEAFASYYRDSEAFRRENPNLYNYFRARDTSAWGPGRAWAWWNSP
jgi:hypothetical protein